jgi:hypothetical protein
MGSAPGAAPPWRSTGDPYAEVSLSVVSDVDTGVLEIALHGRWSRRLCLDVYHALRNSMAEHPCAIIVDLQGLSDLDAASTTMWLAASRAANTLQPPVQLVLTMPPTRQLAGRLRRLGAVRFLPICATMKQARETVASRLPAVDRLHLNPIRPGPASAGAAADAVTAACAAWTLPDLVDPGRQIVRELVANAVVHAGTDVALTMSLRGTRLHLAVRDGDRRLPYLLDSVAAGQGPIPAGRGKGLRMVAAQACAWGAVPTVDGKVVWAMVQNRRGAPQR